MPRIKTQSLIILFAIVWMLLPFLILTETSSAQDGSGANATKCNCDLVEAKGCKGDYATPLPTPKRRPLPPVKQRPKLNVYPNKRPPVPEEKDLPGINDGTGVAADSESNVEKGKSSNYIYRDPDGTVSKNGYYSERRRYVYNTYKKAQDQLGRERGIDQTTYDKVKKALKTILDQVNKQEREAYQKELQEEYDAELEDIQNNVDPQNDLRTKQILDEIKDLDIERYETELQEALEQVVYENLEQGRTQELAGGNGSRAAARAAEIVRKLFEKFAANCDKKNLKVTTILAIERQAQLAGIETSDYALSRCFSATAVAKLSVGGIEYEARKCVPLGSRGTQRFEGDWLLKITGAMDGSGVIKASLGSGNWESTAFVEGGTITQDGPAELISGGGFCGLKLTSSNAVGNIMGYRVRMSGVSGILPIKIIDEKCSAQSIK